jgi:hypothetical protein
MKKHFEEEDVPESVINPRLNEPEKPLTPREEFEAELREKALQQEAQAKAYQLRMKKRQRDATLAGAAIALFLSLAWGWDNAIFPIFMACVGGGAAYAIVIFESTQLGGILIYGGGAIIATLLSMWWGLIDYNCKSTFGAWLVYSCTGAFLGLWAQLERWDKDTF